MMDCCNLQQKLLSSFLYGKCLRQILPFWYALKAHQASIVEPWFVFWQVWLRQSIYVKLLKIGQKSGYSGSVT